MKNRMRMIVFFLIMSCILSGCERARVQTLNRVSAFTRMKDSTFSWKCEEGYLFLEQWHMAGYDGPSGRTAIRIAPLDSRCVELNESYLLPVGYEWNNLFLSDWDESDFGEIDFYDIFDLFYDDVFGEELPYLMDEDTTVGRIYQIPAEEFEQVIQAYFQIDISMLRSRTTYSAETNTYEYRPRGFYDCEPPKHPYPEVVNYQENSDGTITMTVQAVYPDEMTSKAMVHEVTVRPLENGGYQYVSNHIVEENTGDEWHVARLAKDEWKAVYEGDVE